LERDIEFWIEGDLMMVSWNDETIQAIAEEMGEPEFPEPRPCG
jgi:hypothetical protein